MGKEAADTKGGSGGKAAAIAAATVGGVAVVAILGVNIYVHVACAGFYHVAREQFPIPGIGSGFVPQDVAYVEEDGSWLLSGYMADDSSSPLYRMGADGTTARLLLSNVDGSPYTGHGAAVTTLAPYAFVTCEGGYLVFDLQEVLTAPDGERLAPLGSVQLDFTPAFMNRQGDTLYVGDFYHPENFETPQSHRIMTPDGTENPAVAYAYPVAAADEPGARFGIADHPSCVYSIPGEIQGICETDDGRLVLSQSYGVAPSHLLSYDLATARSSQGGTFAADGVEVPLHFLDSTSKAGDLVAPPMSEGIVFHDGSVYVPNEAASSKYLFGRLYGAGVVWSVPTDAL